LTENQKTSKLPAVKATFDLPPELLKELKLRAVHEGRKLKDLATDLLVRGLAASPEPAPKKVRIEMRANTVPLVRCAADAPASRMSTRELLAMEQATLHQEDLQRLGHSL
jgi:hypothetical protein